MKTTWKDHENDPQGWWLTKKHYSSPEGRKLIEQFRAEMMKRAERARKKKMIEEANW